MVSTGHSIGFWGKEGKKKVSIGLPCLDCFANVDGKNETPFPADLILEVSS